MAGACERHVKQAGIHQVGAHFGFWAPSYFQDEAIVWMSCGEYHSMIVTEAGRVFALGCNSYGQLGLEGVEGSISQPTLVATLTSSHIVQTTCGTRFTMFLSKLGEIFSCGHNMEGQLGLGHTMDTYLPTRVNVARMKTVSAGGSHAVALTDTGDVWVTGYNGLSQLGLGHFDSVLLFTRVPNLPGPIIDVSCELNNTALLSSSHNVLMAGLNSHGQMGLEDRISFVDTFIPLTLPFTVVAIACDFYYTVVLSEDGTAWAWGQHKFGQPGTKDKESTSHPSKITDRTFSRVVAINDNIALFTEDGSVYVSCTVGQGSGKLSEPTLWPTSEGLAISLVAFASSYTLISVAPSKAGNKPSCIMQTVIIDKERNVMVPLECPVCLKLMSAPVHQCNGGHSLCDTCRSRTDIAACPMCSQPLTMARNIPFESLGIELQLPCLDCLERMPVALLAGHADVCPKRKYGCPVQQQCGWTGGPETMLAHTSAAHPDQTWTDVPHSFAHTDFEGNLHKYLLSAHGELFVFLCQHNTASRAFLAGMQLVGPARSEYKFKFEIEFIENNHDLSVTFRKAVTSESSSLISDKYIVLENINVNKFVHDNELACRVSVLLEEGAENGQLKKKTRKRNRQKNKKNV